MCAVKMHAAEIDTDASLVHRLLAAQFPRMGTPSDRAGPLRRDRQRDLSARRRPVPSGCRASNGPPLNCAQGASVAAETGSAPAACHPRPAREGDARARATPGIGRSVDGSPARTRSIERFADLRQAAIALAQFVAALAANRCRPAGRVPGAHNFGRGVPLAIARRRRRATAIAKLAQACSTPTR